MVDVYEEKDCCGGNPDAHCGGDGPTHECQCEVEEVDLANGHWGNLQEHWDTVQVNLGRAAADVREALSKGRETAEPVFRDKVAPVLADATAKLHDLAETARTTTSTKAGFSEDHSTEPAAQIGTGLAAIATGLLGLGETLTEWLSQQAHAAAEKEVKEEPETVVVEEPVVEVKAVPEEEVFVEGEGF